jgi:hypothetical protein
MTAYGPVNPSFEFFSDNRKTPCKASGAITGKRFVKIVAGGTIQQPKVAQAGAGDQIFGVAGWDAADGEVFTVHQVGTYSVTAGAALTAPVEVQSDAAGKAVALSTGKRAGSVYFDAALNADAAVRLAL